MATSSIITTQRDTFAPTPHFTRPTFLMCPPEWYGVDYVHNPWMAGNVHRSSRDLAFAQWKCLYNVLKGVADVRLLHPEPGLPDMVFVGHGAVVQHGMAAPSSFYHAERRPESEHLRHWLQEHGFLIWDSPRETAFEGEGDLSFDDMGYKLWAAHGVRTCRAAHGHVADAWHAPVHSLHLKDPRFYHLDTCFAPLFGGCLLYFPDAFDAASNALIEAAYPAERRIEVSETDATRLVCCALNIERTLFTGEISPELAQRLFDAGFDAVQLELSEFIKGGGGAHSLALRLSDLHVTHRRGALRQ